MCAMPCLSPWPVIQVLLVHGLLQAEATPDSLYGLPLLYPYGNCSREMDSQTLNLYLTSTLPDSFKTYAIVKQRKDTRPVQQPAGAHLVTNLTIIPMLLTEEKATSYHQCMSFYCSEPTNNQSCTTTKRLTGMSVTMSPHYPSVMLTAVYQEPQFVWVVPMAPLTSRGEAVYTYYVLFGDSHPKPAFTVPSVGLMPLSTSEINTTLEGRSLVNKNSKPTGSSEWLPLQAWDVVWTESTGEKPSPTKFTSTEPLAVFTGMARENQTGFSYVNMHTHQMPDTQQWGTVFLADLSHTELLLHEQNVTVSFRLLTANSSTVSVTSYPAKSTQRLEMEPGAPETLALPSIRDKDFPTHVMIQGSEKLLILYEVYTSTIEGKATLFSHLLQPIEWHTYKQVALLVPTLEMVSPAEVSISVTAPNTASVLVQTNRSTPVTLTDYEHFQRVESVKVSNYTIHRVRMRPHPLNNSLVFTARESDGHRTRLGVTAYSYSPQSSYAHTNPPVLNDNITQRVSDRGGRGVAHWVVTAIASSAGVTLLLVLILVTVTIAALTLMRPRVLFQKPDPPIEDFEYDVFLSFADRDKDIVKTILYYPLRKNGYRVFWHLSDFIAGLTIAENMLTAIRKSRWIVFVCSEHFEQSEFCQQELRFGLNSHYSTYKGRYRRVVALVLEEGCCPAKLKQLHPIKLTSKQEQHRPTRLHIKALIRRLHFGKPIAVLRQKQRHKEKQRENQRVVEDTANLLTDPDV